MINPTPFHTGFLSEENGHVVQYSQYGNPDGPAVVVLHGGPGSRSKPKHVARFDLQRYHLIAFDQRGCGSSTPAGKTEHNTTQDLVADIERLREFLNIDHWFVTGASWGAALALLYAQSHPDKVRGLLLSSIFLARERDVQWAFTGESGIAHFFPDVWHKRADFLTTYSTQPSQAAGDLLALLQSDADLKTKRAVAAGVLNWEGNLYTSNQDVVYALPDDVGESDIASVSIWLHYESNNFFLETDQIMKNMSAIADIPTVIVHGRHDLLCTPEQAWQVHQRLSNSELHFLPQSNHKLSADGEVAKQLAFTAFLDKHSAHE